MFERFTKDARATVLQAQEEARWLRHDQIGTGHLMLALLTLGHGAVARALDSRGLDRTRLRSLIIAETDGLDPGALASIGIDLDAVRQATEAAFGEGALDRRRGGGRPRFSAEAKKTLELSLRVAINNRHRSIGDGHILLGLLMLPQSAPVRALRRDETDLDALKAAVLTELGAEAA